MNVCYMLSKLTPVPAEKRITPGKCRMFRNLGYVIVFSVIQ